MGSDMPSVPSEHDVTIDSVANQKPAQLDPTVRALGVVSLLNDFSSEVAVRTLPLFLANVLGVRTTVIGLIEGIAESISTLLKLVSGHLSDRIGRKKALALLGLWSFQFHQTTALLRQLLGTCASRPIPRSGR
jgi:MFS family permease